MTERWIADQRQRFSTMLPPSSTMNGRCFLPALTPYDTRIRTPFLSWPAGSQIPPDGLGLIIRLQDGKNHPAISLDGGPRPGGHDGLSHLPDERRGMVVLPRLVAPTRISCILQQQQSHPAAAIWRCQQPPRNSAHAQAKGQRQAHPTAAAERRPPRGGTAGIDAHPPASAAAGIDRLAHGHGGMEAAQDSECLSLFVIFVEQRQSCRRCGQPWTGTVPQAIAAVQPVGHVQQRLCGAVDGRIQGRGTYPRLTNSQLARARISAPKFFCKKCQWARHQIQHVCSNSNQTFPLNPQLSHLLNCFIHSFHTHIFHTTMCHIMCYLSGESNQSTSNIIAGGRSSRPP